MKWYRITLRKGIKNEIIFSDTFRRKVSCFFMYHDDHEESFSMFSCIDRTTGDHFFMQVFTDRFLISGLTIDATRRIFTEHGKITKELELDWVG